MYVNRQDHCPEAIDGFGMYFGDNTIDTVIYNARLPLTFLTPQVQNPNGNVINDEINWVPITGTFVANGTEKYLVIGNFKSDAATNTVSTGYTAAGLGFSEYFVDAVSCIDLDLPAYAYSSNVAYAIPGTTLYLGRQQDVGIDEACMWYKLPNTSTAIDTAAGITITVAATTETYVVKQEICAGIKYDTVVVHPSAVGLISSSGVENGFDIFPNPATDAIKIAFAVEGILSYTIKDVAGKIVQAGNLNVKQNIATLNLDLNNGVYLITVTCANGSTTKKIIINK